MSGNSSNPAGSIFGGNNQQQQQQQQTNDSTSGNNQQQQTTSNQQQNENDSVETLVAQLTSGVVIDNNEADPNQQNQNDNNQQETSEDGKDKTNPIITNLMQVFKGENITEGVDVADISEKLLQGDLSGIIDAMGTTANKAVERALQSVLTLIPEIISNTEARVLAKVGDINQNDKVWDRFVNQFPDYEQHKGTVREHLQKAIDGGASFEQASQAVDMIFSGLKKTKPSKAAPFTADSGSEAFDFQGYLNNET